MNGEKLFLNQLDQNPIEDTITFFCSTQIHIQ
ncbi:hypothetical protein SAMN05421780_101491 [Flexibacter flexilis DSM 6793]|uniref:Uncharacterized protein n=1 Tax=Flexibacter flexilis DSM 6793 TaxID=927664 RepID=A0A1I1DVL2_9BACT|nr:hypothetical protein SAMN05421780_101491 [Flexibacter flexilis DSM 6793]